MEETKELITTDDIRSKVYIIRGQQVMLDKDLAEIYGYDVKRLNEQVKRNINRFPEDFMFQLKASEITESLKSQIATLNVSKNKRGITDRRMMGEYILYYHGRIFGEAGPDGIEADARYKVDK